LKVVQRKGQVLLKGEIIKKLQKIELNDLEIFFSRTTWQVKLRFT
jgi:hypothetical protein